MTNPTPELPIAAESLKLVAEYMGLPNISLAKDGRVFYDDIMDKMGHSGQVFTPITNAEQSMELLKMLLDEGWKLDKSGEYYVVVYEGTKVATMEESLELAIFNAALSHITATQGEC